MKIVSGHQPVYAPWLGLFHKLSLCDVFVFMDTVQYLEKDWNNRNKIRTPHGWMWLTIPIDRNASKGKMLDEIKIRGHDEPGIKDFWQEEHWKAIRMNYANARYFEDYGPALERIYTDGVWESLVDVCWAQFELLRSWLGLDDREVVRMSEMRFEGEKDELVLDHCRKLGGDAVVFGQHGRDYVDSARFHAEGIRVHFQDYRHPTYRQRFDGFESHLSILDLLFNHGPESFDILSEGNVSRGELRRGEHWEPIGGAAQEAS